MGKIVKKRQIQTNRKVRKKRTIKKDRRIQREGAGSEKVGRKTQRQGNLNKNGEKTNK